MFTGKSASLAEPGLLIDKTKPTWGGVIIKNALSHQWWWLLFKKRKKVLVRVWRNSTPLCAVHGVIKLWGCPGNSSLKSWTEGYRVMPRFPVCVYTQRIGAATTGIYIPTFLAALFTVVKGWEWPNINKWMGRQNVIYTNNGIIDP